MTRIKICGITNLEDARAAIDYGAHALGFILVPESPRYVGEGAQASQIMLRIPPFVTKVAVVKDTQDASRWSQLVDAVQFYSDGAHLFDGVVWIRYIRAVRIQNAASLDEIAGGPEAHAMLLDAYHPDQLGGSGETFNWDLAREAKARFGKPIILAGGLTPENVGEAVAAVRPYAVDVSSGVEAEPGRKDHAKLRAFIRAVQEADRMME